MTPDVIVVGAGIIGLSAAWELSRRGARVTIVDQRPAGQGATQASAGVLAPYIEAHDRGPLLDLGVRSLRLFDGFIEDLNATAGARVQYARTGTLEVASGEEAASALGLAASFLKNAGVDVNLLDAAAAREAEPCLAADVVAALVVPDQGYVAVPELVRALADALGARGVEAVRAPVTHIAPAGGGVRVDMATASVTAPKVVLAAGSWASRIAIEGVAPLPVRPVRGQLLRLAWSGARVRRVTWSSRCYLVPWEDGSLLVGATVEEAGYDERNTVAGVRDLLEAASELVPHAWQAGFLEARVGLRPASDDQLPILGRSRRVPGLIYATGHYRNGILLTPLTARIVADLVDEREDDPALRITAPDRFGEL